MFSNCRKGALLYVLEKGENLTLKTGQVDYVSDARAKFPNSYQPTCQLESVVDIKITLDDGSTMEFNNVPSNSSVTNYNGSSVVIADSRDAMNSEIETLQRTSRAVIDSVPTHEKILESCTDILKVLNPQYAREQEQKEKIDGLEERMGGIEDSLKSIQGMLSSYMRNTKNN